MADKAFAEVSWRPLDLTELRPSWSMEQCASWLDDNDEYIKAAMVEAGFVAINAILPKEDE